MIFMLIFKKTLKKTLLITYNTFFYPASFISKAIYIRKKALNMSKNNFFFYPAHYFFAMALFWVTYERYGVLSDIAACWFNSIPTCISTKPCFLLSSEKRVGTFHAGYFHRIWAPSQIPSSCICGHYIGCETPLFYLLCSALSKGGGNNLACELWDAKPDITTNTHWPYRNLLR